MKKFAFLLSVLLLAGSVFAAGGAASLVAKKSETRNFAYSQATRQNFIRDCSESASEQVCGCVLDKLQREYSEKEYLKLDASLQKGYDNVSFVDFISSAVEVCDGEYASSMPMVSEEEAKAYADWVLKDFSKKEYLPVCNEGYKNFYGEKFANKVCTCMFDRMFGDKATFVNIIMTEGYPDDNPHWGLDYTMECIPEKMTPEIEMNFINHLNQSGIPKSTSKCVVDFLKKEYSLRALVLAATNDPQGFMTFFITGASRCVTGSGMQGLNSYDIDRLIRDLEDAKDETPKKQDSRSGRRSRADRDFNEGYAEGGSGGIGDGLAALMGGSGGGIATKAKGSIKTPSERDIDMGAGGGSRSAADIMKVVRQRTPGLRHIYNKYLKKKPGFKGKVTLKLTIAPDGEIIKISIASSTTGYGEFDKEIKSAVSRWKFGKVPSGNTTMTVPFTFVE